MRFALTIATVLALCLAGCGNPDTPGGRAADARHENFEKMGDAFKVVADQLKASSPDKAAIQAATGTIATLAPQVATWFPAGSSPADGIKTHALPAIWEKPDEFKAAAAKLAEEAGKFNALAQAGDMAALGAGMQALGGACKGCHDKFREKE